CGHTFCLTCLSKTVRENKLSCALCRTVTEVINGNAATLPGNLAFRSVVKEVASLDERCDVCDTMGKPDQIRYCQDCKIFMCSDCLVKHKGKTENYYHSVYQTRRSKRISPLNIGYRSCIKHQQRTCEGICVKCNIYVCKECSVIHENEGHEVQDLLQYATTLHATATPLKNDIKLIRKVSKSRVEQCEYHKDKTVRHIDWVMSQINDEYQASLKKIEEKRFSKIKACSDLKEKMCKLSEDLIEQSKKCNSILDQVNYSIQGVLDSPFGDMPEHSLTLESSQSKISDMVGEINPIVPIAFEDGNMLNFRKKSEYEDYDVVELINYCWVKKSFPLTQPEKEMACMDVDSEGNVVVGYFYGGIEVFPVAGSKGVSVDSLKEVRVMAMSFGSDGNLVVRNIHNEISIYGRTFQRCGATFETIDHIKGGDGDIALDKNNDIYAGYRIIMGIHIYRKRGGKAWREIKCDGYIPQQILVMSNLDIIVMNAKTIKIIDVCGTPKSEIVRKGFLGYPAVARDGTLIIAWVNTKGKSVELMKYTQDMRNKKTLHLDNTIDLSGRPWYYCRVIDAEKIVFCCPKQVHIFNLHIKPFYS
ncbi:uncharacterized protein LOC105439806, partial [Strongylocentrotus purpuratus]|uniref:B box-type domain-containing protein n=1 Tax=Strongylocentrotus purpuratus TaxID=7668 RepID=A0A7M7HHH6_STRPU